MDSGYMRFLVMAAVIALLLPSCVRERVIRESVEVEKTVAAPPVDEPEPPPTMPTPSFLSASPERLAVADAYDPVLMRVDVVAGYRCVFDERPDDQTVAWFVNFMRRRVSSALENGATGKHAALVAKEAFFRKFLNTPGVGGSIRDAERDRANEIVRYGAPISEDPVECLEAALFGERDI